MRYLVPVFILFLHGFAFAQTTRPPVHVEIVLDSSGSMLDNDRGRLSSLAGMIFADLADPADLIGVQCMKKDGYTLQSLAPVESSRRRVRDRIRALPFHGATDCAGPLKIATNELKEAKTDEARQFVIFLSDGVCPRDRPEEIQTLLDAASGLRDAGVRVFSLGLFDDAATEGKDPQRDLEMLSSSTNGEYFRAKQAADLPRRFAEILGRILGSEAQPFAINPGKATVVELDGYVADASVIVTSTSRPVRFTRVVSPDGSVLGVPIKNPPFDAREDAFYISAGSNGKSSHYAVLRLKNPASGAWSFIVDAPKDAEAIVIQNYALDPIISAPKSARKGDAVHVSMTLKDPNGETIVDAKFLAKVLAKVRATNGAENTEIALTLGEKGELTGTWTPQTEGDWQLVGDVTLKTGGLKKTTAPAAVNIMDLTLALAPTQGPIDLGELKAGESSRAFGIDLSKSQMAGPYSLTAATDLSGISVSPTTLKIAPDALKPMVTFTADVEHPGGVVTGVLTLTAGATSVNVPVKGTIIPRSFWERYGKLVIAILASLGLLAFILFIARGILGPHNFAPDARINWGDTVERLNKNSLVIREIRGSGSGFYRNAKLEFGGPTSFAPADGAPLLTIEAVGPNRMEIRAEGGAELLSVNKFDHEKTKVVEGGRAPLSTGEIYKVGRFFVRVR